VRGAGGGVRGAGGGVRGAGGGVMKKSAVHADFRTVWETPTRPLNIKCMVPAFFGYWYVEKRAA
jgi:hypothetical protein